MPDRTCGLICLSLAAPDAETLIRQTEPLLALADLVEVRLDAMRVPDLAAFCRFCPKPVLVTNRPLWEGGSFAGSENERLALLEQALQEGASWADIELRTEASLRDDFLRRARAAGKTTLVSWHDFQGTPDAEALSAIVSAMRQTLAQSGKIVTTARTPAEAARVLGLLAQSSPDFPLSAFAMGEAGKITRLATLYLGGHVSYAAADAASDTAPGQIGIRRLHELCRLFARGDAKGD